MGTTRERVAQHRARMRERGYREVRFWVPDVTTEAFRTEALRATAAMDAADAAEDIGAFLDEHAWVNNASGSDSW